MSNYRKCNICKEITLGVICRPCRKQLNDRKKQYCNKCERVLTFDKFYKNKMEPSGRMTVCIECTYPGKVVKEVKVIRKEDTIRTWKYGLVKSGDRLALVTLYFSGKNIVGQSPGFFEGNSKESIVNALKEMLRDIQQ